MSPAGPAPPFRTGGPRRTAAPAPPSAPARGARRPRSHRHRRGLRQPRAVGGRSTGRGSATPTAGSSPSSCRGRPAGGGRATSSSSASACASRGAGAQRPAPRRLPAGLAGWPPTPQSGDRAPSHLAPPAASFKRRAAPGGGRPSRLARRGDATERTPTGSSARLIASPGPERAVAAVEAMNEPANVTERADGYVQDPASQQVAAAVGAQPGELVLDLCAAPGGKALAGGYRRARGGRRHPAEPGHAGGGNADRTGTTGVAVMAADGSHLLATRVVRPRASRRPVLRARHAAAGADLRWRGTVLLRAAGRPAEGG